MGSRVSLTPWKDVPDAEMNCTDSENNRIYATILT